MLFKSIFYSIALIFSTLTRSCVGRGPAAAARGLRNLNFMSSFSPCADGNGAFLQAK